MRESLERLISWKLKETLLQESFLESLAHSVKLFLWWKDGSFCSGMCVSGYISSLPGICGLEEIQRRLWGFGEMLQFALVLVMPLCHVWAGRMFKMLIFKKCIVPELLINLPLPFRLPCYSYLCCSLSLTLKVTISLTKSLALSLVWFISFLLLVAEHLSLILLVGGVWGTCLPLLRPPPHSQALGLANTSFWAGSLHSSLTP